MKKVARLRVAQDEQFVPPGVKINANAEQTVRTTGRIKKPKAVFDPSDNYMPRSHRMTNQNTLPVITSPGKLGTSASTSPSTTGTRRERSLSTGSNTSSTSISLTSDICIVCLKREPRRGGNYRNKLISCVDCNKRVHKLCMSVDFYESAPVRLSFKCDNCRTCESCSGNASLGAITCSKCCKSYHLTCHVPKLPKICQSERHWKCSKCLPIITSAGTNNNKNSTNEPIMPVKIIRQIIGDNVNLTSAVPKTQQPVAAKEQLQPLKEPTKPQQQSSLQNQKVEPEPTRQSEDRVKIAEAAVEAASIKSAALRRMSTDSVTASSSDDTDDEDYGYVEKKKRRLEKKNNNNHDIITASDTNSENQFDQKTTINVSKNSVDDLPKREDVKAWSVEKVSAYIAEYFPNEAYVFKDQEIDGNALLLLKRSDIIQKLPLKLGPSLRLYNLILKVQTQTANDPTLGWDCSVDTLLPST